MPTGKKVQVAPRPVVLGWVLVILITSELSYLYLGFASAKAISVASVFGVLFIGWRGLRIREAYLLGICVVLTIAAVLGFDEAKDWLVEGLSRSAYLASFIVLMALLREGALTSNSVLKIGQYLTLQPPSRRFVALFGGSHFLSVMINLGSLSLLAPIIQRGVRAGLPNDVPLDDISQIRERRQISSALRGFSWFLVWAPTAVTQAVMPTLMSGINALKLIGLGMALATLMLLVSWAEDWLRWRNVAKRLRSARRTTPVVTPPFPVHSARNFGLVCVLLFAGSISLSQWGGQSIITGVMLASPFVVLIWVVAQQYTDSKTSNASHRLNEIIFTAMPGYFREAVFVACAGFIGTVGAKLVPVADIANAIGLENIPGWMVLWGLTIAVWCCGQVGLSPITLAVFLGSIVAQIPVLPVDMTHAALAIAAGTAVCSTGAPFSAGALMLSRATGYSSMTLTWRWNGLYTLTAIAVLALVYMGLEGF